MMQLLSDMFDAATPAAGAAQAAASRNISLSAQPPEHYRETDAARRHYA